MARKKDTYRAITELLDELYSKYPTYGIGRHIATALSDYGDFWGITNNEFLFALKKYYSELELDGGETVSDEYVNKIVKDGMDLDGMFNEQEEQDDF